MNDTKQTTCKRCGRKLRNPQAIELGMGSICWRKFQLKSNHKKLWRDKEDEEYWGKVEFFYQDDIMEGEIAILFDGDNPIEIKIR